MNKHFIGACLAAVVFAGLAQAQPTDRFSGEFNVSQVSENRGLVTATLTVSLRHTGAKSLVGARVLFRNSGNNLDRELASGVSFEADGSARASARVTVPAKEFASWSAGAAPRVSVEFFDRGDRYRRAATLTRAVGEISGAACSPCVSPETGVVPIIAIPVYTINSIAGGGPVVGENIKTFGLEAAKAVVVDSAGNRYFATDYQIYVTNAAGVISTIYGLSAGGYSGDGGPATVAQFSQIAALALDGSGNLYIADGGNSAVRMIAKATGVVTTFAGNGTYGYSGDGGSPTMAALSQPQGLAFDSSGALYIADIGAYVVRKVASGVITTVAGTGIYGNTGNGGLAVNAQFTEPYGVAVDGSGNLYISDASSEVVRVVDHSTHKISTFAGTGTAGFNFDGLAPTATQLNGPAGLAFDASGNLYVAEVGNNVIREIVGGVFARVAGNTTAGYAGDGGLASLASLQGPTGVFVSGANTFVADSGNKVFRLVTGGNISTAAGTGGNAGGDGGSALGAEFSLPGGVAVDGSGNVFIADSFNNVVRKIDTMGNISLVAGNYTAGYSGDMGTATAAQLQDPQGVAVDGSGNVYIADTGNNVVRKVDSSGKITTFAGEHWSPAGGPPAFNPAPATPTQAVFNSPYGVATDASGNVFISDTYHNVVWRVGTNSSVALYSGSSVASSGYAGDSGLATSALLSGPNGLAVDPNGNLFIADSSNSVIRRVDANTKVITTVAGNHALGFGEGGYSGDGGPATSATLSFPRGVAVDANGNLYIADTQNYVVRYVDTLSAIHTVAGNHTITGLAGDGGPALSAEISNLYGIALDSSANVYLADTGNNRIRELTQGLPSVTAVAHASDKVYDGTTTATATCTLNGVAPADAANVTCTPGAAAFAQAGVGTGIGVSLTGIAISGSAASKYQLSSTMASTTANITAKSVTPQVTASNKAFDGTNTATINTCTPSGVIAGDAANVTCSASGATFASIGPGTGITVTATGITLAGSANTNYSLSATSATTTANITGVPVAITVTTLPAGLTVTVDGVAHTTPITLQLLQGNHTLGAAATQQGTPGTRYQFQSWSSGVSNAGVIAVGLNPATFTATYQTQYLLTTSAAAGGTINPATGGAGTFFNSGASVPIGATANSGYTFAGFTGDLSGTTTPQSVSMTQPRTVGANFNPVAPAGNVTITTSPAGLQLIVDSVTVTTPFKTTPGSHKVSAPTSVTGTGANAGTQWNFLSWSQGGAASQTATLLANTTYTANYSTNYVLTVNYTGTGSGVVSPNGGLFLAGATANLTATPASGSKFTTWGGAASGTTSPVSVAMTGPKTVTAQFDLTGSLTLNTLTKTNGTLTNERVWAITLTNPGAALTNVQITSATIVVTGSATVTRSSHTTLPISVGSIGAGGNSSSFNFDLIFPQTTPASRAALTLNYTANGGVTGSVTISSTR